jgi:UDP-N-acetylglucosamine 1-carboxyvinyltransferase
VIFAGAILGRYKKATFSYPGGCDIGSRPIDLHLKGFEKLGVKVNQDYGKIICETDEIKPAEINLDFPSVGATENIMLLSVLSNGTTVIVNAAMEPEIVDLQNFLNKMGAKIKGAGSNVIKIEGVHNLKDVSYQVMPDRIETGTLLVAAAITEGEIKLKKVDINHISPIIDKLIDAGCKIKLKENEVELKAPKKLKAIDIKTMPYPGFPTDMQAIMGSALCVANGTSMIIENIFENRFKYLGELQKMGAKVKIEGKTAIIKGVRKLYGSKVQATDLRGGASLVLAGLVAKGTSKIENIEYILRGYENLDEKLKKLGAEIYAIRD